MTFRVGQKVVCVDDTPIPRGRLFINNAGILAMSDGDMGGLTKGRVYTINYINIQPHRTLLVLAEIRRKADEPGFYANRFRPVVERKTDISIFTAMLAPKKHEVDA